MSKTDAANAIAEMMTVWNTIEARVKAAHPNADAEAVYRITADAMTNAVSQAVQEGGEMREQEMNTALLDSTRLEQIGYAIRDSAHRARRRAQCRLGMLPGDYGFWLTALRAITGTSGCVAGREWWRRTADRG